MDQNVQTPIKLHVAIILDNKYSYYTNRLQQSSWTINIPIIQIDYNISIDKYVYIVQHFLINF